MQLVDDVVVLRVFRLHHLHCLVIVRIERLARSVQRFHAKFGQRIMELPVDQFDAFAKLRTFRRLQCAIETVDDRQQRLHRIRQSEVTKILLLTHLPLAKVSNSACNRASRS